MTTYYINSGSGDDSTGDGSQGNPWATIKKGVESATSNGDIVEITDEETYVEVGTIDVKANDITLTHTASALGRPVLDASGLANNNVIDLAAYPSPTRTGFTLNGIEVKGSEQDQQLFTLDNNIGGTNADGLTITDCFVYGITGVSDRSLSSRAADGASEISVRQSSFMFSSYANDDGFRVRTDCQFHIQNCFLSKSFHTFSILAGENGSTQTASTASFCTLVYKENPNDGIGTAVIKRFGQVINCVVSASGNHAGIDSNNHSYNIVNLKPGQQSFQDGEGNADSAGTGDLTSDISFIDGTSVGQTFSVVENYALADGSNGVDNGITFDSINIDIIGTARPQNGSFDMGAFERLSPPWNDNDDNQTYNKKFGSGFEIHGTANKLTTRTFPNGTTGRQAPYFVTIPGPANLRRRTTPYKNET